VLRRIEELGDIVMDELNVKKLDFTSHETALASLKGKADFKKLGPRLGPKVKAVAAAIAKLHSEILEQLVSGEVVKLGPENDNIELKPDEVVFERIPHDGLVVAAEGHLVVALDKTLTPDLVQEGLAREFVNKIQNMRKTASLEVTQRIVIEFSADEAVREAVRRFSEYIKTETLGTDCKYLAGRPDGATDWDINGHPCGIAIDVVGK
jgi:isoleucyl-tRNA synthetase